MKIEIAVCDLRETFLSRIFKNYPDHKKMWEAKDIQNELSGAMYEMAVHYFELMDAERDAVRCNKTIKAMSLEIDALHEKIRNMEEDKIKELEGR